MPFRLNGNDDPPRVDGSHGLITKRSGPENGLPMPERTWAIETILFIPGLLCDETVWGYAIDHLRPRYRCVVADGASHDSITAMAEHGLAAYEGGLSVVGHSMGARVAMEMWRLAPQRIDRLALFDTGVHPRKDGEVALRQKRIDLAYEIGMPDLAKEWLPPMVHPDRRGDAVLMGALTAMVESKTPEIHENQIRALLNRPNARALLEDISCPTLLGVGRQDQWSPLSQHQEMLDVMPNARLVVIEDAAHFAPIEQPDATLAALVGWLEMT